MAGEMFQKAEAREFYGWQEMQYGDGALTIPMAGLLDRIRVLSIRLDRIPEHSRRYGRIRREIISCQEEYRQRQVAERTERSRRTKVSGKRVRKVVRFLMEEG